MASRRTSLSDTADLAISREIDSKYDDVKNVSDHMTDIVACVNNISNVTNILEHIPVITNVGSSIDSINTIANIQSSITALASDVSNINKVASDLTNIDIVAVDLTNIDLVANAVDSIEAVITEVDTINTVKNSLQSITTAANGIAKIRHVSDRIDKVNTVANSIDNVNVVGTDISNVDKVAHNVYDIRAVSRHIDTIANITTYIMPNVNELLDVNNKADHVDTVKNYLDTVKNYLDNLYVTFDTRYMGAKSSDPIVDNYGNPLIDGALYLNTSTDHLRVYDKSGTRWITLPQTFLSEMMDVVLVSRAIGDILYWDGSNWVNIPISDLNVKTATKLFTPRTISATGDATWSTVFDGASNVSSNITLANTGVIPGSYKQVTIDSKGRVLTGYNPSTVAEFGLTDVFTKTEVNTNITTAVNNLVNGAPEALNTLQELAAALGDDANFSTTLVNNLATKVSKNNDIIGATNSMITYDNKGLVTGGTTPTTLSGYSINDAYTKTEGDARYESKNANIQNHIASTSNPHGVTKTQVGLGNVDNTSDVNKPISTATQTELDLKANRIDVDDLFTDASNLGYDDTFTDMRVADVQAALAHLGEESKYWSNIHSAVRLFGGIIQDNGDGTVRVANGGGLFKKEASSVEGVPAGECEPMQLNAAQGGKLFYETWEATENVQLTNNAYNYIFIVWDHTFDNGDGSFGKARVIASTNFYLQDWESEISYYNFKAAHPELTLPARRSGMLHGFTVGRVYKMDNEITIRVCGTNGWNFNKRVQLFGEEFFPVIRARGLDIQTIPNTLQFNVTEGVMWAEMANRFTVRAFEMDKGDTFTSWYQHTAETTALTLAQIQSTYPTGIANRKYDILYSSTDTKYYRLNPSNNTWGEVLDYINSKVSISTHPANLSVLETLAPTGYVNNSEGTDYVVLQLQATDSFYRYNPNAALGNRWELFGDKSTVHPYVAVAFLGDVAGMNAEYPTGFNDVINVIVGCADGMYYEYSGVSGQSGWKRVQGYIERNGWLRFYKQSAVDALRYNDSTNNKLVDLENGMYGVAWIYMVHDNSCHVVYGQGAYTSEEAKQAALPSPLPGILAAYSTLVGKMTFSRGATTFENAESPFIEKFISSGVSLHNDLAGLDGGNSTQNRYYHLDEPAYNLVNTFADVVDVSPEGDLAIVGDYSGANALFSGNLTVGGTTSGITKTMVGLGLVDNTADSAKNVLSATKLTTARTINGVSFDGTANIMVYDNTKAPLASPSLTGIPVAPTANVGTSTTQLATTAFVVAEINKIEEW